MPLRCANTQEREQHLIGDVAIMHDNMSIEIMKVCAHCKTEFPATEQYFYKKHTGKFGVTGTCRECWRKKERLKYQENPELFLGRNRRYVEQNREKVLAKRKEYVEAHKEKCREQAKEYARKNPDRMRGYWKKYYYKNRKARHITATMYRLRKHGLESNFTAEHWEKCCHYFNYRCAYCGEEQSLAQDHFIPVCKGGEYTINNIVPACKSCNSSKNGNEFKKWYKNTPFYSDKRLKAIYKYLGYTDNIQQLALL